MANVFSDNFGTCFGAGFGGHVGRHGHGWMRPIGMILRQRLDAKNVKSCMGDLAAVERCEEGIIVNQWATARVNDEAATGHEGQAFGIEDILCSGC